MIDYNSFRDCPPVLSRLLGKVEGFAAPNTDESGKLTFAQDYGIKSKEFLECIRFLRNGHVRDVLELIESFDKIGGCPALDEYYKRKSAEEEE